MYCNLFDSVRNNPLDSIQTEGFFYHSILSGYHPTLALNQIVDTAAIRQLCATHSEFGEMIEQGAIRVSLFGKFRSVDEYLSSHLEPIAGRSRNPFIFSSLPFLYSGEYSDAEIQQIYNAMLNVIQGNSFAVDRGIFANPQHHDQIEAYLRNVCNISKKLDGKYLLPKPPRGPSSSLSRRFEDTLSRVADFHRDTPISPAALELRELIHNFRKLNQLSPDGSMDFTAPPLDSRSFLYANVSKLVGSLPQEAEEVKAIIDLCYNERVAASIDDGEPDLMIMDPRFSSLDHYSSSRTMDSQSHIVSALDSLSAAPAPIMSWEMLKELYTLSQIRSRENPTAAWCEILARCSEEVGLPSFEPGPGISEQAVCFSDDLLRQSNDLPGFAEAFPAERLTSITCCCVEVTSQNIRDIISGTGRVNNGSLKSDYADGGK